MNTVNAILAVVQPLVPVLLGQFVPWITKLVNEKMVTMSPQVQWLFTGVLAPVLTSLGAAMIPGSVDPASAAALGTGLALTSHAHMQSAPMQKKVSA